MKYIIPFLVLWVAAIIGCEYLAEAVAPTDWAYHPPVPSTPPPDTCTQYVEIDTPAWVTLYMLFDDPQDSILWQGGGVESYDLAEVVAAVTPLPFEIDTHPIGGSVFIRGTLDHQQYQLKIFARIGGAKWYMGTAPQRMNLPGAPPETFMDRVIRYPGMDMLTYWGTDWDSLPYVQISREVVSDCKAGRWYADFYWVPWNMPSSLLDTFDLVGWERIRHQPQSYVVYLSASAYTPEQIRYMAMSGRQMVIYDDDTEYCLLQHGASVKTLQ